MENTQSKSQTLLTIIGIVVILTIAVTGIVFFGGDSTETEDELTDQLNTPTSGDEIDAIENDIDSVDLSDLDTQISDEE